MGFQVKLVFQLTQDGRDEKLIRSLIKYLDCGHVNKNREAFDYRVTKFDDITNKIIPFFYKHKIHGVKAKDFNNFCKAAELIKGKKHLTKKIGDFFEQISKIKGEMNQIRELD